MSGPRKVAAGRPLLLTPHPGEMSRLLGQAPDRISLDRVATAREAAESFACAVVFKGAPSLTTGPGATVLVDSQSSSDLAAAGMGDVLTGVCGSLLAQGAHPVDAGALGLYLSGRGGTLAGRGKALIPTDVIGRLHEALAERGAGATDLTLPFVLLDADPAR